ncbi:hypothetical protein P4H39_14420 [Paenibacillus lautus]|nr:hypothetical protein [Paenibacillus lautus]MEC0203834.1 hypothetical protein [Paenibacillus lautus]
MATNSDVKIQSKTADDRGIGGGRCLWITMAIIWCYSWRPLPSE